MGADESTESTSAPIGPETKGSTSGDLEQVSQTPQVGQRNSSQPSNDKQIQRCQVTLNAQAQIDQASNDEPTQAGQGSSDAQKTEVQQSQQYNNDCESAPSEPLLMTDKTWRIGRARDWTWEMASMATAVCCLLGITITLIKFDRQEQPSWPYASTLNLSILVALIATILRSMLENVLNAEIGQLKWRWFRTSSRPLNHMNTYEEASRSTWGSLLFLFSLPRMNLATFGATVTVLSVVIGAFTQQAIQTIPCQKPSINGRAAMQIAQTFLHPLDRHGFYESDVGLQASLVAGLAGLQFPNSLSPTCSSGNCTFQRTQGITYTTAGFSSECIDISSLITQGGAHSWSTNGYDNDVAETSTASYSLPNGPTIQYSLGTYEGSPSHGRWNTMLARRAGVLALDNVTMTERQRHIVSISAIHGTTDSMIFLMPTKSPCLKSGDYHSYLGNEYWPMPSVHLSECSELAHNLPGVTSIPGYFSVTAAICYYYPSIQNFDGSVINGKLVEQPVGDPIPLGPLGAESWVEVAPDEIKYTTRCDFLCGFADPCIVDNIVYKNTSTNLTDVPGGVTILANVTGPYRCLYGLDSQWQSMFIDSTLSGIILGTELTPLITEKNMTEEQNEVCSGLSNYTAMVCPRTWWLSGIYNGGNASVKSINDFMKRGFDSFTSQIRTIGVDWDGNQTVATGTSHETAVCIQFRWAWLLYPSSMVVGTLILLLAIIANTEFVDRNREAIWKTSILPHLFYGLEDGERKGGAELEPEGALKKAADPVRVQLMFGNDGWRLHAS